MKLKRLEIKNFLGIGEAEVDFEACRGLTLIEGINHDSSGASSNGAGKSSLMEALYYALYGITKRGLKADAVVNDKAGKECCVTLYFDDYRIVRQRKIGEKNKDNGLSFGQRDKSGAWNDLSLGTAKDTQARIEQTIKISPLAFGKMAFFGQGDIRPFASLTDSELKQVFEQSLGITFISECHSRLKAMKAYCQTEKSVNEREQASCEMKAEMTRSEIGTLKATIESFEKDIKEKKAVYRAEIEELDRRIDSLTEEIGNLEAKATKGGSDLAPVKDKLAELDGLMTKLLQAIDVTRDKINVGRVKAKGKHEEREKYRRQLAEYADLAEKKLKIFCDKCGRQIREYHLPHVTDYLKRNIDICTLEAEKAFSPDLELTLEKYVKLKDELVTKVRAYQEQEKSIRQAIYDLELKKHGLSGELKTIVSEKGKRVAEMAILEEKRTGDFKTKLAVAEAKLKGYDEAIADLREKAKDVGEELELIAMLEKILGDGGLKSHILDSVTPELNKLANHYIQALDPCLAIEVSTVAKLASGELRDRFQINVTNQYGSGSYAGNSGGEKQKINLAIALAFNRLIRAMFSENVPVIVLDEPFESLDEVSGERVVELLDTIDTESVFLISHSPFIKDLVANKITVEKKDGRATLKMSA